MCLGKDYPKLVILIRLSNEPRLNSPPCIKSARITGCIDVELVLLQ